MVVACFLSHYLSGPLPCLMTYTRKQNVLSASLNKTFPSFLCTEEALPPNLTVIAGMVKLGNVSSYEN